MKRLIIFLIATMLGVASGAKGAQVYTPPSTSDVIGAASSSSDAGISSWSANTLYVIDGTGRNRVALRAEKDVSQLDIADISSRTKKSEFAAVDGLRLDSLVNPLMGESLGMLTFAAPPSSGPGKQLLAIAWLFAIGLIGIATVGRRKKL